MRKLYSLDLTQIHDALAERNLPTDGYEVLGVVPLLWSGWECDTNLVLVSIPGQSEPVPVILDGTQRVFSAADAAAMLRERLDVYQKVIAKTEEALQFLSRECQK
jgi:hypothetical protein